MMTVVREPTTPGPKALPGADWQKALVYGAASDAGVLAALPGTAAEVAAASGAYDQAVRVVLDALEAWDIVASNGDGRYERGPAWPEGGEGLGLLQQARFIRGTAAALPDRMRGEVSPMGHRSKEDLDQWQEAMAVRARTVAPALADVALAHVPHARSALDLGGGHGEYGLEFARRGLRTVLQDRPAILESPHRRQRWAAGGVEVFPGDFFEILPDGPFDLVFLAGVTHTFDGAHNLRLYQRVRPLVAPDGALVIVTFLRGSPSARLFAVQMLVVGNGGDTHAEEDYRRWLEEAGFGAEVVAVDDLEQAVIVARPARARPATRPAPPGP